MQVAAFYDWLMTDDHIREEGKLLDPEFTALGLEIRQSQFGPDIVARVVNFIISVALIHSFAGTRWHGTVPLSRHMILFMHIGFMDLCQYTLETPSKGIEYVLDNVKLLTADMRHTCENLWATIEPPHFFDVLVRLHTYCLLAWLRSNETAHMCDGNYVSKTWDRTIKQLSKTTFDSSEVFTSPFCLGALVPVRRLIIGLVNKANCKSLVWVVAQNSEVTIGLMFVTLKRC